MPITKKRAIEACYDETRSRLEPEGPAMRTYTVWHGRSKHDFIQPVNLSLGNLMQLIDQHWVLLGATEYQVFYQDQPLTEGSWTRLCNIQNTAPLTLRAKTIGKPFSMYITKGDLEGELELRKIAKNYLQVTLLDATGSPRVQDELFPELQGLHQPCAHTQPPASSCEGVVWHPPWTGPGVQRGRQARVGACRLRATVPNPGCHGGRGQADKKRSHISWVQAPTVLRTKPLRFAVNITSPSSQACELQHMPTYAVVATATDYRLLAYAPPGSGNNAALFASSPQTLPLANPQTDPAPAIRSLVCKLAGVMCRQAEATDRVMEALGLRKEPGILPNMLTGEDNNLQQQLLDAARDHEDSENEED